MGCRWSSRAVDTSNTNSLTPHVSGRCMKCPRDGTELQTVVAAGVELDKCHKCDGLWLDYGELEALRKKKVSGIEEELERTYGDPQFKTGEVSGYMRCPRCDDDEGRLTRHHVSYF